MFRMNLEGRENRFFEILTTQSGSALGRDPRSYLKRFFGLHNSSGNLCFYLRHLFGDLDFTGKRVLDIGGGYGLISFYAAYKGARQVICLEPMEAGSDQSVYERFLYLQSSLSMQQVKFIPTTIQTYEPESNIFDVVILHNSINHIDELACESLCLDRTSHEIYRVIFQKIFSLSAKKAVLIVCDCSNRNLFHDLGISNPFAPTIEWQKHQPPEVWVQLLTDIGFKFSALSWTSYWFRSAGKWILRNKLMSYLTTSHYCLTMEKE